MITACVPRQSEITQTGNLFLCLVGAVIFLSIPGARTLFERRRLLGRRNTAGNLLLVSYMPLALLERERKSGPSIRQIRSSPLA